MTGYQLGIDLGTTCSAAAVCRAGTGAAEPAGPRVASVVFSGPDGAFLIGDAAQARALDQPARVVGGFVARVGDPTPMLVGREPVAAEALAARFVGRLVEPVLAREGASPSRVALAHPTGWGRHRVDALSAALNGRAAMVPQAVAAVVAHRRDLGPGALVAVHDFGGATFDAAVVRLVPGGAELVAAPEVVERLGGADVDEAVFAQVRAALGPAWAELDGADPAVQAAVARLRRECTAAKERLSSDTETRIDVRLPGVVTDVRLTRAELEEAVRPAVLQTVDALTRALDTAGVAPADLADVLLVGGSARIPLVAQLVSAGLGRPVTVADDAQGVFAAGAALWAARQDVPAGAPVVAAAAAAAQEATPEFAAHDAPEDRASRAVVARPPKQASAFPTEEPAASKVPLFIGVGLLVLTILGALVVVGASRYAARNEAVATTPTAVTPAGQQATTSAPREQAARPAPPARRAPATVPPTTTVAPPPATSAPPTTAPPADADAPPPNEGGQGQGEGNDQNGGNDQPNDEDQNDGGSNVAPDDPDGPGARNAAPSTTPTPAP